jgi:hypothetical protein
MMADLTEVGIGIHLTAAVGAGHCHPSLVGWLRCPLLPGLFFRHLFRVIQKPSPKLA